MVKCELGEPDHGTQSCIHFLNVNHHANKKASIVVNVSVSHDLYSQFHYFSFKTEGVRSIVPCQPVG